MSRIERHRPRLAAVGDNCIDLIRYPSGREVRLIGGNAVNVAVQARHADLVPAYFGAVGADAEGELVRQALEREQVDHRGLVMRPLRTSITRIDVRSDGDRVLTEEDFGACRGYAPAPDALDLIRQADHVHLGWIDDGGTLRRLLAAEGRSVSQDLSVNANPVNLDAEGLSIAFGSCPGAADMAVQLGRHWLKQGAKLAVVTRGPDGAIVVGLEGFWRVPAEPVVPVDTTGAGDAFVAGFLGAWLRGAGPESAARSGARLGCLACLHEGGFRQNQDD